MKLTIEHMVCARCVESVRDLFSDLGIPVRRVELGRVETASDLHRDQLEAVGERLNARGFALIQDRTRELIEKVNVELIAYLKEMETNSQPPKLSDFISERLHYNYAYLSKLYSDEQKVTIESHLIKLKIERVKELLDARNRTLSEIAWLLNYSSVQYLSNQFKKITGETVTEYLNRGESDRKGYDRV